MFRPSVVLLPWDPDSPAHVERMRQQRVACGWKVNKIADWQKFQKAGELIMYWVALPSASQDINEIVQRHLSEFPDEAEPLQDTCTSVLGRPHTPNSETFIPVGHICLDGCVANHAVNRLNISFHGGVWAIAALYVSRALQGTGIGGAAMTAVEKVSVQEYGVKALNLCTDSKEDSAVDSPRMIALKRPVPKVSNVDWYQRRGYVVYDVVKNGISHTDSTGRVWHATLVYFRKELA
ncbi:hypothetical protein AB5N19_03196 [Seiridium cardinale]